MLAKRLNLQDFRRPPVLILLFSFAAAKELTCAGEESLFALSLDDLALVVCLIMRKLLHPERAGFHLQSGVRSNFGE